MSINVLKDESGKTIQFTDIDDNCITKIDSNYRYSHFCANCGNNTKDMKFISETGYYDRAVTLKCKCNSIVKYHG